MQTHPYFLPITARPLSSRESLLLFELLSYVPKLYAEHVSSLTVIGRCGCGSCPTVFFNEPNSTESHIVSCSGKDELGNAVGVALLAIESTLTQLEFWSLDGQEPWTYPTPKSLVQIQDHV